MKITKTQLREIIREELLKEQMNLKSAYYELGDAVENFEWVVGRNTDTRKDAKLKKHAQTLKKIVTMIYSHLEKNHSGWD